MSTALLCSQAFAASSYLAVAQGTPLGGISHPQRFPSGFIPHGASVGIGEYPYDSGYHTSIAELGGLCYNFIGPQTSITGLEGLPYGAEHQASIAGLVGFPYGAGHHTSLSVGELPYGVRSPIGITGSGGLRYGLEPSTPIADLIRFHSGLGPYPSVSALGASSPDLGPYTSAASLGRFSSGFGSNTHRAALNTLQSDFGGMSKVEAEG